MAKLCKSITNSAITRLAIAACEAERESERLTGYVPEPCCITPHSPRCYKNQTLAFTHSQFFSSKSFLRLKKQSLVSALQINKRQRTRRYRSVPVVFAAQSNFLKGCIANIPYVFRLLDVVQTVWKVGRDGIEAGTNLVLDSVPRSIARVSLTVVALALSFFVLKSLLSTVFFVLATMGLVYFTFIALNKDEGPKGGGGTTSTPKEEGMEDSLEEARRIMEKLKKQSLVSALQINKRQRTRRYRSVPVVFAAQSNFLKG
ncbi:unnamed protein product [Prunus armeniaca]|uniref:Uncharacterized protein n=1 Tax=Prunus armeniaca TaxID=36596 RepID=A0A6J5VQB4_PRUAR|nr:unnamed protein product [Prunus armeniaca]